MILWALQSIHRKMWGRREFTELQLLYEDHVRTNEQKKYCVQWIYWWIWTNFLKWDYCTVWNMDTRFFHYAIPPFCASPKSTTIHYYLPAKSIKLEPEPWCGVRDIISQSSMTRQVIIILRFMIGHGWLAAVSENDVQTVNCGGAGRLVDGKSRCQSKMGTP